MLMHDLIPVFPDRDHLYVRELMKKALACPVCNKSNEKLEGVATATLHPRYAVICKGCNNIGPFGKTLNQAIKNWNKCVPRKSLFKRLFRP
jgi:transposase-like protein